MQAFYLLLAGLLGGVLYREFVIWRQRRCDACRIERDGGTLGFLAHTCSKRRALYRHKKGQVTEFGKKVGR